MCILYAYNLHSFTHAVFSLEDVIYIFNIHFSCVDLCEIRYFCNADVPMTIQLTVDLCLGKRDDEEEF